MSDNTEQQAGVIVNSNSEDAVSIKAHDSGVQRMTTADLTSGRSGLLATARHPVTGSPAASLTDSAVIEYQGQQMPLSVAARLGLVQRDAQGNYSEVTTGDATKAPTDEADQQEQQAEDGPVAFSDEGEAYLAHVASEIPAEFHVAVVEQLINGRGVDGLDVSMGELTGLKGDQYRASVGGALNLFKQQADSDIAKQGIVPEDFYAWAWQNPQALKAAMREHAASRSTKAYASLIKAYVANTSPSTEAMTAGGYETRTERDGSESVCINGMWTSVRAAVKAGLL